ncbi:putative methyltransferase [Mycobacterium kansasii]|uniref:Putative methyltransferase n=1 Tax=Mycobacterium kansasii TaxID=1768 RepID=A0A1V3XGN6_MYCKA|nr:putative methyltransferase [Mycobacterium kansasii]
MNTSPDPRESTRGLLNTAAVLRHGFLDVLGESTSSPVPTLAQRAMNSRFVATVYERLWRPTSFYLASGITARAEQRRAAAALRLSTAHRLLDVACGRGISPHRWPAVCRPELSRWGSTFPNRC